MADATVCQEAFGGRADSEESRYVQVLQRSIAALVAFAVGWVVYMVAMVLTVYDGCLSLVFQPFMAAICSGLFVGAALLVGLVFKLPVLGRWWRSSFLWAGAIAAGSLFFL